MITHVVNLILPDARAEQFYDAMIDPVDALYQQWLPEEHWEFHIVKRGRDNHLHDLVYYDEILGTKKHRLKFYAIVTVADRPNRIVYRMRKLGLNLPGYLDLAFFNAGDGLALRHEVRIGWRGVGAVLDPVLRLVFNKAFFTALEEHCDREWVCLAKIIRERDAG